MGFMVVPEFPDGTIANSCFTCRVQRRPTDRLVDLGVTIEYEGHAVICETCAREIADILGWASKDVSAEVKQVRGENANLKAEVRALRANEAAVRAAVNA